MKKFSVLALVLGFLFIVPQAGYCMEWQEVVEKIGNGSINWSQGIIQAKGIGAPPENLSGKPNARPMAIRAAKLDAIRSLLEITKGVRITSSTTVKNFAVENDIIMSEVEGMVKGAQVVQREYLSDGTVEVTMQMSLSGGFAQLVLPKDIKQIEPIKSVTPVKKPLAPSLKKPFVPDIDVQKTKPDVQETKPDAEKITQIYTGLVVNAKGINVRPAMAPKIIDENGQEVYGSAYVSREFAVQQGMSGYTKDLEAALNNPRVTDNPLIVKGLKTKGTGRSDIVVSNADAALLRSASENLSFLKKCRVMIVVD